MAALAFVPMPNTRDSYSEEIMADAATDGINGFNDKIIAEFRAIRGRVSGSLAGTPMILIHHVGAKSEIERITPLACNPQDDGRIVIVASNGGSPTHPSWYYNVKANPRSKSRSAPKRSRYWRKSWTAPPAPSCGRS
jgi:deazaflavin-dependent oxidoreductase (nitroreductase family)